MDNISCVFDENINQSLKSSIKKITEKISNTNHIPYSNNHKEIAGKAKVCHNAQNI
jgi:hypothetical protein